MDVQQKTLVTFPGVQHQLTHTSMLWTGTTASLLPLTPATLDLVMTQPMLPMVPMLQHRQPRMKMWSTSHMNAARTCQVKLLFG